MPCEEKNRQESTAGPKTDLNFQLLTRQQEWDAVAEKLQLEPALALDIESNGYFGYPERICLIQIGLAHRVFLLDPLTVQNLKAFGKILAAPNTVKVFHSCENDLRALHRNFGFRVKNIFDTSLAAHFLGAKRLGLSNVLQEFLNIELPKSKTLQRQDWSRRPLNPKSLAYAAGDVAYLLMLRDELAKRLQQVARMTWVEEENRWLEKIKANMPLPAEELFWSIKGNQKLNDKERAILQQLAIFREALCREMDRAPFRVLPDDTLIHLAQNPDTDLIKIKALAFIFRKRRQSFLRHILKKGKRATPIPVRKGFGKRNSIKISETAKPLMNLLKHWRNSKGRELSLDPAILWPMSNLERLAYHQSMHKVENEVREWQKAEFYQELETLLLRFREKISKR
jgi:ribonuclease D